VGWCSGYLLMEVIFYIILLMYNYQAYLKEQELQRKFEEVRREHNRTNLQR